MLNLVLLSAWILGVIPVFCAIRDSLITTPFEETLTSYSVVAMLTIAWPCFMPVIWVYRFAVSLCPRAN